MLETLGFRVGIRDFLALSLINTTLHVCVRFLFSLVMQVFEDESSENVKHLSKSETSNISSPICL